VQSFAQPSLMIHLLMMMMLMLMLTACRVTVDVWIKQFELLNDLLDDYSNQESRNASIFLFI
jgi:hypothetical protein